MEKSIDRGAAILSVELNKAYLEGYDDYHMKPLDPRGDDYGKITDGDSVIFCCRRGEREVELTEMFTLPVFNKVERKKLDDIEFVPLTRYHEKFSHLPIAFPPMKVTQPLAEVLSKAGKSQFHIAESEKFAHVTFFFNGGENTPFPNERDKMVPSPKGIPFESKPELSLEVLVKETKEALGNYDFVVVNFANGDVIGHTPDTNAKIKACSAVSSNLEKVVMDALEKDYVVFITADHGNIEALYTKKGLPHVAHTTNKVRFMVMDGRHGVKAPTPIDGTLGDVAPTILQAMGIEKPDCMTGNTLTPNHNYGKGRKALLVILDGWGEGSKDEGDAIFISPTPYWNHLISTIPSSLLEASGRFVGLGEGKSGNSEAGHMNLGAGRRVIQDDIRIDDAMKNGEFEKNEVIKRAIERSIEKNKSLHLITYLTYKSSHGSMDYGVKIASMSHDLGQDNVFLHIIFDGRSTENGSAPKLLEELEEKLNKAGTGYIVDGIGRGLVLDRDGNYENVKLAYDLFVR